MNTDRIRVQLAGMAHGGAAFGRHQGQVIFVPYALPGETVLAQVEAAKKGWARARLLEILEASADRVEPLCPHFGPTACGGCHWQHSRYAAQLGYKTGVVRDQLARLAGLEHTLVRDTLQVGEPWAYRNHVRLHAGSDGLGYVAADGVRIQPITVCPIMHPLLVDLFDDLDIDAEGLLQVELRAGVRTGQQMIIFMTVDDEPIELSVERPVACVLLRSDGTQMTLVGRHHIVEQVAGRDYQVSAASFFQVNTAGADRLVQLVLEGLEPRAHHSVLDLYAGVGLFSLALAEWVGQVWAVEASPAAVADLRFNVQACGADNVHIQADDVVDALGCFEGAADTAVVDPPRAGCGASVVKHLVELQLQRLVYVACDPATLARDARLLTAGGYQLAWVQPVDMFPQTYHIESVALFRRP